MDKIKIVGEELLSTAKKLNEVIKNLNELQGRVERLEKKSQTYVD